VLSIVAGQFLRSLDAVRAVLADATNFRFTFVDEDEITIVKYVGYFITMNPG
jgi:hypothetical protein